MILHDNGTVGCIGAGYKSCVVVIGLSAGWWLVYIDAGFTFNKGPLDNIGVIIIGIIVVLDQASVGVLVKPDNGRTRIV
jgi:hypothetical protein